MNSWPNIEANKIWNTQFVFQSRTLDNWQLYGKGAQLGKKCSECLCYSKMYDYEIGGSLDAGGRIVCNEVFEGVLRLTSSFFFTILVSGTSSVLVSPYFTPICNCPTGISFFSFYNANNTNLIIVNVRIAMVFAYVFQNINPTTYVQLKFDIDFFELLYSIVNHPQYMETTYCCLYSLNQIRRYHGQFLKNKICTHPCSTQATGCLSVPLMFLDSLQFFASNIFSSGFLLSVPQGNPRDSFTSSSLRNRLCFDQSCWLFLNLRVFRTQDHQNCWLFHNYPRSDRKFNGRVYT